MPIKVPNYPSSLNPAAWQKHKAMLGKVPAGVDVGALLDAAQKLFQKIRWEAFDLERAKKLKPGAKVADDALAERDGVEKFVKQLSALEGAAKKQAADWGRNAAIPPALVKELVAIGDAARRLAADCAPSAITKEIEKQKAELEKKSKAGAGGGGDAAQYGKLQALLKHTMRQMVGVNVASLPKFVAQDGKALVTGLGQAAKTDARLAKPLKLFDDMLRKLHGLNDERVLKAMLGSMADTLKDVDKLIGKG